MSIIDERAKQVITEHEIRSASAGDTLRIDEAAILTPLAQDLLRERGIQLERVRRRSAARRKRIALGADHGGFEMKEELKRVLADLEVADGHPPEVIEPFQSTATGGLPLCAFSFVVHHCRSLDMPSLEREATSTMVVIISVPGIHPAP